MIGKIRSFRHFLTRKTQKNKLHAKKQIEYYFLNLFILLIIIVEDFVSLIAISS